MMFISIYSYAQTTPVKEQDSIKTGYSLGQISLPNPKSIIDGYTYDPVSNKYIYTASVDGFNINYPLILTPEEYEKKFGPGDIDSLKTAAGLDVDTKAPKNDYTESLRNLAGIIR